MTRRPLPEVGDRVLVKGAMGGQTQRAIVVAVTADARSPRCVVMYRSTGAQRDVSAHRCVPEPTP